MKTNSTKAVQIVAPPPKSALGLGLSRIRKLFPGRHSLARSRSTGLRIAPPVLSRRLHPSPYARSHLRTRYGFENNFLIHAFTLSEGATHVGICDNAHKCAFTLAEVLITLGIIGIVAAMTIPTLIQNYQNKAWNTSAQVFERKLEETLKTMNTQQVLAGYSNTADFVGGLSKYFKITKVCKNNDITSCFDDNITVEIIDISSGTSSEKVDLKEFKTAADLGQEDWDSEAIGLQFANGTTGVIAYNPQCKEQPFTNTFSGTSCISLIYDTNGFKTPNTFTKDVRGVNSFLKDCAFKSGSTCFSAPFHPDPLTKAECEELKDDLGIAACHYDNDYWAGAVKACGGVSKMPTMAQLADIANYVYNTSGIGSLTDQSDITLDYDKVAALGFKYYEYTYQNSSFIVWSGEEDNRDGNKNAFYRFFDNNRSSWATYFRNSGSGLTQAICIGD